jgi:hypothetical protein
VTQLRRIDPTTGVLDADSHLVITAKLRFKHQYCAISLVCKLRCQHVLLLPYRPGGILPGGETIILPPRISTCPCSSLSTLDIPSGKSEQSKNWQAERTQQRPSSATFVILAAQVSGRRQRGRGRRRNLWCTSPCEHPTRTPGRRRRLPESLIRWTAAR